MTKEPIKTIEVSGHISTQGPIVREHPDGADVRDGDTVKRVKGVVL